MNRRRLSALMTVFALLVGFTGFTIGRGDHQQSQRSRTWAAPVHGQHLDPPIEINGRSWA
jgi:hypothetical protein